jgi:alpha-tubulin suppressor-like RCC1 family protein
MMPPPSPPPPMTPPPPIVAPLSPPMVAAGAVHTCAVTSDGAVLCWGDGTVGELGNGSTAPSLLPVGVVGLSSGARAVSAGGAFSCGIDAMGAVLCWGLGAGGELGNGTSRSEDAPGGVVGLSSGARAVCVGQAHACAVTATGAVACWGDNTFRQLGDGSTLSRTAPVGATGDSSGFVAVACGGDHTCALLASGVLHCWGRNVEGQLGDGSTVDRSVPVVVDLPPIQSVSAGSLHTCAVTSAGAVKCWGKNDQSQLGDGTTVARNTPADVVGASSGFVAVAAGGSHTCGLTSSGGVACWGQNEDGQLGTGTPSPASPVPVMSLASGIASISAGLDYTCAMTAAGRIRCWGYNGDGELGDGTNFERAVPVDVLTP